MRSSQIENIRSFLNFDTEIPIRNETKVGGTLLALWARFHKKFDRKRVLKTFAVVAILGIVFGTYQNCGNIGLSPNVIETPLGSVTSDESKPTPFRLPDAPDYNMRVAFFVDVSASMSLKGCPGDGADHDQGDCMNGNTGYDPYFNRLRMIENWIVQMDDYLMTRNLPMNRLEMAFIPFSMAGTNSPLTPNGSVRIMNRIDVHLNQKTFTSDRQAIRRVLDSYRKMYHSIRVSPIGQPASITRMDPAWGLANLEDREAWHAAATAYIKTSIPAPSLDAMNTSIINEINQIRSQTPQLLSQTRFEVVFLSDGVAKPHHEDIRQSFELLWRARKIYRDWAWGGNDYSHCSQMGRCEFQTVDFSQGGQNCSNNCRSHLDHLIRTGQRTFTESPLCRKCVLSVLDYTATPSNSDSGPNQMESFLDAARYQWGDHQPNYNINIQRSLRNIETTFKQNAEVEFRFNFVRFDSEFQTHKTPPLLLTIERNWLEQSKVKFRGQHRHAVVSSYTGVPFALFPGQSEVNGYKLSHFFLVNPHARINSVGVVTLDSDADGLFDHEEDFLTGSFDKQNPRSDGACLDVISFRANSCNTLDCDPQIDQDGDGLNQCDENTVLTDDMDSDTDGDGISDYFEVVYGTNPNMNDSNQDNNGDGVSNFVNFTLGAGPWTDITQLESYKKIQFTMREADPVRVDINDQAAMVPTYAFRVTNLPTIENLSSAGAETTYFNFAKRPEHQNRPPMIAPQYEARTNRVLMIGRVDHSQNLGDIFWVFKPIDVPFTTTPIRLDIELNDLQVMPWLDPDIGGAR